MTLALGNEEIDDKENSKSDAAMSNHYRYGLTPLLAQMSASVPMLIREKLHTESLMKWFPAQKAIIKCSVNYG